MLHAQGLRKRYRAREVVRDFSFRLDPGEVVGLLGPNGAGKTTCFYIVVGLVAADAGRIALDDRDITALPMHVRARLGVGYLPQEPSVFRRLTVADNVMAILELREGLTRKARETELARLLEELHVSHLSAAKGQSLSGGERRRVEIARALAAQPRYMLLDEPFAGVDPISVSEIQKIVRHLKSRGHRRADHRPQRARDPGHRRPRLHPQRRRGAGRRRAGPVAGRPAGTRGLPGPRVPHVGAPGHTRRRIGAVVDVNPVMIHANAVVVDVIPVMIDVIPAQAGIQLVQSATSHWRHPGARRDPVSRRSRHGALLLGPGVRRDDASPGPSGNDAAVLAPPARYRPTIAGTVLASAPLP